MPGSGRWFIALPVKNHVQSDYIRRATVTEKGLSRRQAIQLGLGAAATAGLVSTAGATFAHASDFASSNVQSVPSGPSPTKVSIDNAYLFLDQMMDAYVQGSTVRLCQSYCDQIAGGTFFSTAFIYDNALLVLPILLGANLETSTAPSSSATPCFMPKAMTRRTMDASARPTLPE